MVFNNDIILEFGTYNATIAKDCQNIELTLPKAYKSTNYSVQVQVLQTSSTGSYNNMTVQSRSTTKFYFGNDGYAVNVGMTWLSIGY